MKRQYKDIYSINY